MDLITELTTELKLGQIEAMGLAVQVIGVIEDAVRERESAELAMSIGDAVPELYEWQTSSPTLTPGAVSLAEVPQDAKISEQTPERQLKGVLQRFEVDEAKAGAVGALMRRFLVARLQEPVVARLSKSVAFLGNG